MRVCRGVWGRGRSRRLSKTHQHVFALIVRRPLVRSFVRRRAIAFAFRTHRRGDELLVVGSALDGEPGVAAGHRDAGGAAANGDALAHEALVGRRHSSGRHLATNPLWWVGWLLCKHTRSSNSFDATTAATTHTTLDTFLTHCAPSPPLTPPAPDSDGSGRIKWIEKGWLLGCRFRTFFFGPPKLFQCELFRRELALPPPFPSKPSRGRHTPGWNGDEPNTLHVRGFEAEARRR